MNKERFDLIELISNTIQDVVIQSEKANSGKLKFVFYKHEDDENNNNNRGIIIEADKARITQVLLNLLNNAIKFTEEGTISINVKAAEDENNKEGIIIVSVKDTGDGIDSEIMPRLFEKFATKSVTGGTGLGLFISKSIIEAHGGKMWAENNNADTIDKRTRGAIFYFSVPVMNEPAAAVNQHKQQIHDADNQWKRI